MTSIILASLTLATAIFAAVYATVADRRARRAQASLDQLIETLQATPRAHDSRFDIL